MKAVAIALVICLLTSCSRTSTDTSIPPIDLSQMTPPARLEPGEAESRERLANVEPTTKWSHPAAEVRGVWIDSKEMMRPREQLLAKLDQLKRANFNVVLVDTWFRGYVAYAGSAVVPEYPELKGDDVVAA